MSRKGNQDGTAVDWRSFAQDARLNLDQLYAQISWIAGPDTPDNRGSLTGCAGSCRGGGSRPPTVRSPSRSGVHYPFISPIPTSWRPRLSQSPSSASMCIAVQPSPCVAMQSREKAMDGAKNRDTGTGPMLCATRPSSRWTRHWVRETDMPAKVLSARRNCATRVSQSGTGPFTSNITLVSRCKDV